MSAGLKKLLGLFAGKKENKKKVRQIKSLAYSRIDASGGAGFTCVLNADRNHAVITLTDERIRDLGELFTRADDHFVIALEDLCRDCRIDRWNGFSGKDPKTLGGGGFALTLSYADGKKIHAEGYNAYPKRYDEFSERMDALLRTQREKLVAEARKKKIERGVEGDLEYLLMQFHGHGAAGSDSYKAVIAESDLLINNFELSVRSFSGEAFPCGVSSLRCAIPNEKTNLKSFAEIMKKYGVIYWDGFDKKAEDPDNAEWFQLSAVFKDGRINAHGTAHPQGYEDFRTEFLKLLFETAVGAEKYAASREEEKKKGPQKQE